MQAAKDDLEGGRWCRILPIRSLNLSALADCVRVVGKD
jgi:hypothetical protein